MIDFNVYAGKRVLVTGSSGFKGSALFDALVKLGATVAGYDVRRSIIEDVRDAERLRQVVEVVSPSIVFHLAAQAFVPVGYGRPQKTFATNAQGTVNVLEAVRVAAPDAAVVVVTTDKVYGDPGVWHFGGSVSHGVRAASEVDLLRGRCPYSTSKVLAEEAARCYRESYDMLVATARAGNVIGPGDFGEGRLVPNAVDALRTGRPIPVFNERAVRPWQFLDDVIDGYLRLGAVLLADSRRSDSPFASAFNFGPVDHHTVGEVVEEVIRAWGSGRWERVATSLREVDALWISSAKARQMLGWRSRVSFEEMITHTVRWYKENGR